MAKSYHAILGVSPGATRKQMPLRIPSTRQGISPGSVCGRWKDLSQNPGILPCARQPPQAPPLRGAHLVGCEQTHAASRPLSGSRTADTQAAGSRCGRALAGPPVSDLHAVYRRDLRLAVAQFFQCGAAQIRQFRKPDDRDAASALRRRRAEEVPRC